MVAAPMAIPIIPRCKPNACDVTRIFLVLLLGFTVIGTPAMATEEPKFSVFFQEGAFEIRDYQAAVAAEVTVDGDQKTAASRGFRLLAGYIFGGNTRNRSIAMTAPVAQTADDGAWVVRFTMPSGYTLDTLPQPNDPKVTLHTIPPARFAVLRFSGLAGQTSVEDRTAELIVFTKVHRLRTVGPVSLAQYNPPWTPWFMRRNEVMIRLET